MYRWIEYGNGRADESEHDTWHVQSTASRTTAAAQRATSIWLHCTTKNKEQTIEEFKLNNKIFT